MAEDEEPETLERDPNTSDMFGAPAAPPPASVEESAAYTVIARKYRPRTFEDLYGQEAMVRTLRNAFASGRIAHAFMLTGVRGVGKTTTARLLARALNYDTDAVHEPNLDLREETTAISDIANTPLRKIRKTSSRTSIYAFAIAANTAPPTPWTQRPVVERFAWMRL